MTLMGRRFLLIPLSFCLFLQALNLLNKLRGSQWEGGREGGVGLGGGRGGGRFPFCFCGAGLCKKAQDELDLLADKQRICSHRESRSRDNVDPRPRGEGRGCREEGALGGVVVVEDLLKRGARSNDEC